MPNDIQVLTEPMKIGDIAGNNYVQIFPDGTIQLMGQATMWEDMVTSLTARRLESTAGKVDYAWADNAIKFQSGGDIGNAIDRVIWTYQKHHGIKLDSEMRPHIHFVQPSALKFEFTMQYRFQKNGKATETDWVTQIINTDDNSLFTYLGPGDFNQIVTFTAIDTAELGISDTVEFRLARTDSVTGDILAKYVDAHCEFDTFGSRTEWGK